MHFEIHWSDINGTKYELEVPVADLNHDMFKLSCTMMEERIGIILTPKKVLMNALITLILPIPIQFQDTVGVNGYQSWTFSNEYRWKDTQKKLSNWTRPFRKKYHLEYYGDAYFNSSNLKKGSFLSYHYIYIKHEGKYFFWASTNEKSGFTTFQTYPNEKCLRIRKEVPEILNVNQNVSMKLMMTVGTYSDVKNKYSNYFETLNPPRSSGWTSWYQYYHNINETLIGNMASKFEDKKIPLDYIQIDDGWQMAIGDWEPNKDFKTGMQWSSDNIHDAGYQAGLWIAPFICEEKSSIYSRHSDWIAKDSKGNNIVAGFSPDWSGNFYALDFDVPAAAEYLESVFRRAANEWGFSFFKLDFLYAACIGIKPNETRGQRMYKAMTLLRKWVGKAKILGCGVPLGSATSLVDYCRVSADVALKWEDTLLADIIRYPERVSTFSCLSSNIQRQLLDGVYFQNDPDVFILREGTKLNNHQKRTLFNINQVTGSLLFTSDDVTAYDLKANELYFSQFPLQEIDVVSRHQNFKFHVIDFKIANTGYRLTANLSINKKKMSSLVFDNLQESISNHLWLEPYESVICKVISTDIESFSSFVLWADDHLFPAVSLSLKLENDSIYIKQLKGFRTWNLCYYLIHPELIDDLPNKHVVIGNYKSFTLVKAERE